MHFLGRGRVVVTGGAGFIGSALVWALNLRGIDDILVVDRLDQSEKWKNLVPLRYRDYMDASDFESALLARPDDFKDVSALLHLGACSSTTETNTAFLMRNNYEYTKHLAQWAIERGVRFVYASSAATYGGLERNLRDDCDLDSLRPLNMYAYSKHRFDLFARDSGWLDKITGLKYFNVFGPNEQHKGDMRSLVDKAFSQIQETGAIRLFKSYRSEYRDGEQRRDFLYVKDAADMTLHLAGREAFGLYNLGSGQAHTWLDLVRPIFRSLRVPERIEFVDMPPQLRDKYQYCTCATIDRLRAAGYDRPATPLDRAVDDYVSNYLLPGHGLDPAQAESSAALNRSA
ncbi:MAG TPA: ADP-glyceromanno-heptose 6-epimerase [Candidatus Rubrimentiphilum sp.]|nr:ADP-glyceromanno-heptose 6-epimerase [Candidatus Rubrimentiphilum sp.]